MKAPFSLLLLLLLAFSCSKNADRDREFERIKSKLDQTPSSNVQANGQCTDQYESPLGGTDFQLDAQCQSAYYWRCLNKKPLNSQEVQAACANYKDMAEPGAPECPYCN